MNKRVLKKISVQCLLAAGLFAIFQFTCQTSSDNSCSAIETNPYWASFLSYALDDADVDLRDSSNRPVKSSLARSAFQDLFAMTVFKVLVSDDLPVISAIRKYIEEVVAPCCAQLSRKVKQFVQTVEIAILFGFKRLVDNVNNLWITLFSISISLIQIFFANRYRFLKNVSYLPVSLPLRC